MYASDAEVFGNGTQSYVVAYEINKSQRNWYKVAQGQASRLLSNEKICKRINELLDGQGYNDENVRKQHTFLLNQQTDLTTKLGAVKEYNRVTGKGNLGSQATVFIIPVEVRERIKQVIDVNTLP